MSTESKPDGVCPVCQENSSTLYQCCSTKSDSLCETCWSKTIKSMIDRSNVAALFNGQWTCAFCTQPIDRNRLPDELQSKLSNILLTIPKTKSPTSIGEFHYAYNKDGQLRHCVTDEKFMFLSQRHYNALGACLDIYIQSLLKSDPWKYQEMWLPTKEEPTDDHHDQVNIFHSDDFQTNTKGCLILIQGSGVVRPGQWARSCCINDSLDIGAMFPYMSKAKENGLSVIILNPNQTSFTDEDASSNQETSESDANDDLVSFYLSSDPLPRLPTKKIPNLSTNREHVLYAYDHIIKKLCPAEKLYVVAHSAGGEGLMFLLRKCHETILPKLAKIAFTDSVHSLNPFDQKAIKTFLQADAIHFVASNEPIGTPIVQRYGFSQKPACEEVSAGHAKHEYTSGHCVQGVFDFFFPPKKAKDDNIETTPF